MNKTIILLIAIILSMTFCKRRNITEPKKNPNLPEDARWCGGIDGGVWIVIHNTEEKNKFQVLCFSDMTGDLIENDVFEFDVSCQKNKILLKEIVDNIDFYDGVIIGLKTTANIREGCFLKKVNYVKKHT